MVRYLVAAVLARGADAGAVVALVLLAPSPSIGGALAACLTAPHLFGPLLARRGGFLAPAFALYGVALAAATLSIGRVPLVVTGALVVVAGLCGPLLTGGLSSRLAPMVAPHERAQRRAQGWDAVTYGIGGSAGPAAVAALAALTSAAVATLALACAAVVAAGVVLVLPRPAGSAATAETMPVLRALRLMAVTGNLRRVTYLTLALAIPAGAVPVLAVALGGHLRPGTASGAVLAAVFGVGNLLGSLVVTAFPLRGEPEVLVTRWVVVSGVAFAVCAAVPGYWPDVVAFGLLGAANAPYLTATLAARAAYAPPGARVQVFVSSAALKVACASLGAAVAGTLLSTVDVRLQLLAGGVFVVLVALGTVVERRAGA